MASPFLDGMMAALRDARLQAQQAPIVGRAQQRKAFMQQQPDPSQTPVPTAAPAAAPPPALVPAVPYATNINGQIVGDPRVGQWATPPPVVVTPTAPAPSPAPTAPPPSVPVATAAPVAAPPPTLDTTNYSAYAVPGATGQPGTMLSPATPTLLGPAAGNAIDPKDAGLDPSAAIVSPPPPVAVTRTEDPLKNQVGGSAGFLAPDMPGVVRESNGQLIAVTLTPQVVAAAPADVKTALTTPGQDGSPSPWDQIQQGEQARNAGQLTPDQVKALDTYESQVLGVINQQQQSAAPTGPQPVFTANTPGVEASSDGTPYVTAITPQLLSQLPPDVRSANSDLIAIVEDGYARQKVGSLTPQQQQSVDAAQNRLIQVLNAEQANRADLSKQHQNDQQNPVQTAITEGVGGVADVVRSGGELLDKPRQAVDSGMGELVYQTIAKGASPTVLQLAKGTPLGPLDTYNQFVGWAGQNPEIVKNVYENGYTDPKTGQTFTGGRAVWEAYQGSRNFLERGVDAALTDPTMLTPIVGRAGEAIRAGGEALSLASDATRGEQIVGKGAQLVGGVLKLGDEALNAPVDATVGLIKGGVEKAREASPAVDRLLTKSQKVVNKATASRIVQALQNKKVAESTAESTAPIPTEPKKAPDIIIVDSGDTLPLDVANGPEKPVYVRQPDGVPTYAGTTANPDPSIKKPITTNQTLTTEAPNAPTGEVRQGNIFGEVQPASPLREGPPLFARDTGTNAVEPIAATDFTPDGAGKATVTITAQEAPVQLVRGDGTVIETVPAGTSLPLTVGDQELGAIYDLGWTNRKRVSAIIDTYGEQYRGQTELFQEQVQEASDRLRASEKAAGRTNPLDSARFNVEVQRAFENAYAGTDATLPDYVFRNEQVPPGTFQTGPKTITVRQAIETAVWSPSDEEAKAARAWLNKRPDLVKADTGLNANEVANQTRELRKERMAIPKQSSQRVEAARVPAPPTEGAPTGEAPTAQAPAQAPEQPAPPTPTAAKPPLPDGFVWKQTGTTPGGHTIEEPVPVARPGVNPEFDFSAAFSTPTDRLVGGEVLIRQKNIGSPYDVMTRDRTLGSFKPELDLKNVAQGREKGIALADEYLTKQTPPSNQTVGFVPHPVQRMVAASLPTARETAATQMARDLSDAVLPERARAALTAPETDTFLNTTFTTHPTLRGQTYAQAGDAAERKVVQDMRDYAALKNAERQGPLGTAQQKTLDQLEARYAPLGQLAVEQPVPSALGGYVNGGMALGTPEQAATHFVPNPEFPVASAVRADLNAALDVEFPVRQSGKVGRFYDQKIIATWQKLRLMAPWNFLHYILGNAIGDSFQMATAGYGEAALRQLPEARAMYDLAKNPGYGMLDSPLGETLNKLGLVTPPDLVSANMSEVTLGDSRVARRIQGKAKGGWIGEKLNSYQTLSRNIANGFEWGRRGALGNYLLEAGVAGRREDLVREAMVMAEKPGGRWEAIDPNDIRAVIDSLGTAFSPNDVRAAVEKYAATRGLNPGSAGKYADALGRRWASIRNEIAAQTISEVNRVLFSYDYTNLDEVLKRVVPFHFWATRALPFYVEQGMRHPGLIAAYARAAQGMKSVNEAQGWPPYLQKAMDLWNTPLGYALFWNPLAALGTISLLSDVAGNDPQGQNILGKMLSMTQGTTGLTLYPWFTSLLNLSGSMGKTSLGLDPLGIGKERRLFGFVVQSLANQGALGPDMDRLLGKPYEQFLDEVRGKFGDLIGNNIGTPDANSGPKAQLSAIVQAEIRKRDGTPDGTALSADQLQEANDALSDPSSKLYQTALNTYVGQNSLTNGINLVIPGYVQAVNTDLNATYNAGQAASKDNGPLAPRGQAAPREKGGFASLWRPTDPYADGTITPEEQAWLTKWKDATGKDYQPGDLLAYQDKARLQKEITYGSPAHNKLVLAQEEIKTVGTDQQRAVYATYYNILYGNGPATIGGQTVSQTQLQQMDDTQRSFLADQWLAEDPQRAIDLGAVKDLRDAYTAAHPEYQAYVTWRSAVNKQPSLATYRAQEAQVNPNAARYYKEQRAYILAQNPTMPPSEVEARLDQATTSIAGYEAVKGLQGDVRAPKPTDTGSLPADVAMVGAGGDSGSSGPQDPVVRLQQQVQEYQAKSQQANAYLSQLYGFPVDVTLLPPGPVLNTALAQLPPGYLSGTGRARDYLLWARGQQAQGQPADLATYVKIYGP